MRKLLLVLVLLSMVAFAQSGTENIQDAMCQLQNTALSLFAITIIIFILLAMPVILLGIYFVLKKKEMKNTGIILIIAGAAIPVLLVIIYLMIPYFISMLTGSEVNTMECY